MPTVSVLPLRLYRVTSELVAENERNFYYTVANQLFPTSEAPLTILVPTITTPLDHMRCSSSEEVCGALSHGYEKSTSKVDCLVIDLTNPPYRLLPDHHILGGLLDFLGKEFLGHQGEAIPVVLLMPIILAETDIAMRALKPLLEDGRINLIADDGSVKGAWNALQSVVRHDYTEALRKIRQDTKSQLSRKMIRHPGHFIRRKPDGTHDHCLPFFFDGRFCQKELIELIEQHAFGLKNQDGLPTVLYHCPESRWLYDAVMSVCLSNRMGSIDADQFINAPTEKIIVPMNCVLVVPLIDTRKTLKKLLLAIQHFNPAARISILSIIVTDRAHSESSDVRIDVRGTEYAVNYLLRANRPPMALGNCPACNVKLRGTETGADDPYLKLTSYNLWTMFLEAGTKPEDDVPETRSSIGLVPDLLSVLRKNSPYLALKVNTMLRANGRLPADPIILHPNEKGALALAASLSSLYSYTSIAVPREVLRSLSIDRNGGMADWRSSIQHDATQNGARWVTELVSLEQRGGIRVILMDEFNKSGGTRAQLEKVSRAFGIDVWCYFCFVDFQPATGGRSTYPYMSLYDLDPELAQ